MFLDGDMSKVTGTNSNNDTWDDNNILRCKDNPNHSLKEQLYNLSDGFKIDRKEVKSTTASNLPLHLCPVLAELVSVSIKLKRKGKLNIISSKRNAHRNFIPPLFHVLTVNDTPRHVKKGFLGRWFINKKFNQYLDP